MAVGVEDGMTGPAPARDEDRLRVDRSFLFDVAMGGIVLLAAIVLNFLR